ncbi:MAG: hypothetical protein PHE78_08005, partial [Candidatus Gastranaerophilales bacterium]|nr:hypothetical protein [Candidatus Gastranaerophilales bacterium]
PYASFENVSLSNGPSVSNVSYGALVGFDTNSYNLKKGWKATYSAYSGYTGSHQNYDNVGVNQNGGVLGATGLFAKGNFFEGLSVSAGASNGQANTMYGNEDFTMLMAGIASKTGYNFEFKEGKYIIQPSLLVGYSFINTFDYTNAAKVDIHSEPLHSIQVSPGIKYIANLKNGWQPYVGLSMVWNIMDESNVTANNVELPQMSIDPYVQYGIGLQRRIGERFTGFGQTMFRGGGRNGVALTFGFRWAIGKEPGHNKQENI